jgi:hypothetical protein
VNDHNCSCVTYFLQLILIQIARRVKVESGESDHKSLTVFFYKYFSLRDAEDISKMKRLHFTYIFHTYNIHKRDIAYMFIFIVTSIVIFK